MNKPKFLNILVVIPELAKIMISILVDEKIKIV